MKITAFSAILGFLAVACGAFGAHGLENNLSDEALGWWETGTFYLLVHAALGAALSAIGPQYRTPALLFGGGGALFAGTLYAMALGAPRILGAVTPLGGVLMLSGWGALALTAWRARGEAG